MIPYSVPGKVPLLLVLTLIGFDTVHKKTLSLSMRDKEFESVDFRMLNAY